MKLQCVGHVLVLSIGLLLFWNGACAAGNIDPHDDGSQYAYGENVGWINFEPSFGPGVTVTDSAVTGYAWGENIGWIHLNPAEGGVINNNGALSGYAWGENVGWINFAPAGGGVTINPGTGEFSGRAWGENVGWITFRAESPVAYGVTTSWPGCENLGAFAGAYGSVETDSNYNSSCDNNMDGDVDGSDLNQLATTF
jgi:hypothetical protein